MKNDLSLLLIAARPDMYDSRIEFTDKVMSAIQSTEILSTRMRKMNVNKKETFIMKLRHLPTFVVIAIALGAVLLLGGTTYAIYKTLWKEPTVTVQKPITNQFGRTQVIASLENCGDQSAAATFEIKSGSTLDPSEIHKILQARCEMDIIRNWSGANMLGAGGSRQPVEGTSTAVMTMMSPVASKIVSIDATSLALTGDEYNTPKDPLALTAETQYIVDNQLSTVDKLMPSDAVVYVEEITSQVVTKKTPTGYSSGGSPISRKTTHVVKVDLPFEYYGPSKQNQIAQREACSGNPQDSCVQTASVDLYEAPNTVILKPDPLDKNKFTNEMRSVQGVLTEYNGSTLKIKSSSGRLFTLETPSDIVANFNDNRSSNYNNTKVEVGDLIIVSYIVDKTYTSLSLNSSHIISINLGLSLIYKSDPIKKY